MPGIVGYGAYVPYWRVDRPDISSMLGGRPLRGTRAAASYDEDTTTMAIEAARLALRSLDDVTSAPLFFATTEPAYLDKTNANAIHAALDLDASAPAFDMVGSARSGVGAVVAAERLGGIAVISDVRSGPAGSNDDSGGGDAAAALVFGEDQVVAELVGTAHATHEFMERWRLPGERASHHADERFVEHVYSKLTDQAVADALKAADISSADVNHLIVSAGDGRVARAASRLLGAAGTLVPDLSDDIGFAGAAHWPLLLTSVLDRAGPRQYVVVVAIADGVTVMVVQATAQLEPYRAERSRRNLPALADQLEGDHGKLPYARYLAWRGTLQVDSPPRPEPQPPSAAAAERNTRWKYGFVGSRDAHGFIHLPPARVSSEDGAVDDMAPVRMADTAGTIAAFTVDHLAYSPAPPVVDAVVDFDGGGRTTLELTDVDRMDVRAGDRVEMTFRRLYTAGGIHDYFWKARPLRPVGVY
jgi:hydroxymethylglutaryl-CoA synthase